MNTHINELDAKEAVNAELIRALSDPAVAEVLAKTVLNYLAGKNIIVKCFVLPGGLAPMIQMDDSVGFDVHARAIVSKYEMCEKEPRLRKTLFDFKTKPAGPDLVDNVRYQKETGEYVYVLNPNERILVGVGAAFDLPLTLFQWLTPRSGSATKLSVTLGNAPGTIDPGYHGEAGALIVNHSDKEYILERNARIGQLLYQPTCIPSIVYVESLDELGESKRGSGGFGSTGYK